MVRSLGSAPAAMRQCVEDWAIELAAVYDVPPIPLRRDLPPANRLTDCRVGCGGPRGVGPPQPAVSKACLVLVR
ncbi:hypothetical protein [Streptomyces sp. NPDC055509]